MYASVHVSCLLVFVPPLSEQQWAVFSGSNFFLSQIFLIAGVYITKYLVTVRNRHKCFVITQVWG